MGNEEIIIAGSADDCELIKVCLTPTETPKAYAAHVRDLMKSGMSKEEAEKVALEPIELELFYEEDNGLFAVDSMATENYGVCHSPYSNKDIVPYED